jgi:WD40 repeat protein
MAADKKDTQKKRKPASSSTDSAASEKGIEKIADDETGGGRDIPSEVPQDAFAQADLSPDQLGILQNIPASASMSLGSPKMATPEVQEQVLKRIRTRRSLKEEDFEDTSTEPPESPAADQTEQESDPKDSSNRKNEITESPTTTMVAMEDNAPPTDFVKSPETFNPFGNIPMQKVESVEAPAILEDVGIANMPKGDSAESPPETPADVSDKDNQAIPVSSDQFSSLDSTEGEGPFPVYDPEDPPVSRDDLLAGGTRRLPIFRTSTSSFEALASADTDFVLRNVIGKGGQGEVWRAWQASLAREVAIKRLASKDADVVEFLKESYTHAELDHPNIVPVYDLGRVEEDGEESPLLAMKMLRGTTWDDLLEKDFADDEQTMEDRLAKNLPIFIDVANAVAFAHSKGIIHRDLKPSQVIIGEFGEVFLLDWGLAVCLHEDVPYAIREGIPKHNTLQTASNCSGTPAYMAPEQTRSTTESLGLHTDIYLLGAILFEIITGKPPHLSGSGQESFFMASVNEHADLPENCPSDLHELVEHCLEADPNDRPHTVLEVRTAIEDYLSGASKRSESRELIAELRGELKKTGGTYGELADCENLLGRAEVLWPQNPDIIPLRNMLLEHYTFQALELDDLGLARIQAERIEDEAKSQPLLKQIDKAERLVNRQMRQRRILVTTALVLGVLVAVQGLITEIQRRYTAEQVAAASYNNYLSNIQFARSQLEEGRIEDAQRNLLATEASLRDWEWGFLLRRSQVEMAALRSSSNQLEQPLFADEYRTFFLNRIGEFRIWDIRQQKARGLEGLPTNEYHGYAYHTGSDLLALVSRDSMLIGNTLNGWKRLHEIQLPAARVELETEGEKSRVKISGDGACLAVTTSQQEVLLYHTDSGELFKRLALEGDPTIKDFAWSPDGKQLAIIDANIGLRFYDTSNGKLKSYTDEFLAPSHGIFYHPFRPLVIFASSGDKMIAWNWKTEKQEFTINSDSISSAIFSLGGENLITAHSEGSLRFWDTITGEEIAFYTWPGENLSQLSIDQYGERLLITVRDGLPRVANIFLLRKFQSFKASAGTYKLANWNSDRTRLYLATSRKAVAYDAGTRRLVSVFSGEAEDTLGFNSPLTAHAVLDQHSGYLTGHDDGRIIWHSTRSKKRETLLGKQASPIEDLIVPPSATKVVSLSRDSRVRVVDVKTRGVKLVSDLNQHGRILGGQFFPDEERLLLTFDSASPLILSLSSGKTSPLGEQYKYHGPLTVHPGEPWVAFANNADGADLWDIDEGRLLNQFIGHAGSVTTLEFSPNGMRLLTGFADRTARLWDAYTARELTILQSHKAPLTQATFSWNAAQVLTVSEAGRVLVWDAEPY